MKEMKEKKKNAPATDVVWMKGMDFMVDATNKTQESKTSSELKIPKVVVVDTNQNETDVGKDETKEINEYCDAHKMMLILDVTRFLLILEFGERS